MWKERNSELLSVTTYTVQRPAGQRRSKIVSRMVDDDDDDLIYEYFFYSTDLLVIHHFL